MQKDKFQESLDFVSRHYQANAFSAKDGLENLDLPKRQWWRSRGGIAAAVAAVALVASAAIFTVVHPLANQDNTDVKVEKIESAPVQTAVVKKIVFEDADIVTVIKEIQSVYGVQIYNLPTENYHLTLSYEGTAADLVDTINDLLGINLKISE